MTDRPRAATRTAVLGQARPSQPPETPWRRRFVALAQHGLIVGPLCGVLSGLYAFHLAQTAPAAADPAVHATLRQIAGWHGHTIHTYYITPAQNALLWALSAPAIAWMVLVIATLAWLGLRTSLRARR